MRFFVTLKCLCIALVLLGVASCAMNSLNLREGIYNFKQQNYRTAFVRLMPEAEKGNPDAQYAVGYMYYYGEGVVEDKKKSRKMDKQSCKSREPRRNRGC